MSTPPVLILTALSVGLCLPSCSEGHAWDQPGWRPPEPSQRIVLASVLAAESLIEVLPRERLAGAHEFAADPSYSLVAELAKGLPLLGATPEELLNVRPDLVVVDAYTRSETLALLAAAGVPVVRTLDPHNFQDIEANLRLLGRVTHLQEEVDGIVTRMRQELAAVETAGKDLLEWRLLSLDGALHTHGEGSLFDAITKAAGSRNLAAEHGVAAFRKLDIEEVLAWRPDAIVLSGQPDAGDVIPDWMKQCPGMDQLPCVKSGRLLFVPGPLLSTTSHHLVDAVASIQRQLRAWGKP